MKNEKELLKVLKIAEDLSRKDFKNLFQIMLVMELEDRPKSEAETSYDIIISELNNEHDRADLERTYCQEALDMSYNDWAPIYKALGFAGREQFSKGRANFGKANILEMLASAVNDLDLPMTGTIERGPNAGKALPASPSAVSYLESI